MNKTLSTSLSVIIGLALAAGIFFAGSMYARANVYGPSMMFSISWNNNQAYGPSMMNGNGGYGMGPGMMGNYGRNNDTNANSTPLTVEQAKQAAEKYIQSFNLSGLETGEVMIFDNNAYVVIALPAEK